jgi:hypothetical protein
MTTLHFNFNRDSKRRKRLLRAGGFLLAPLVVSGCTALTTQELVNEAGPVRRVAVVATRHCSGSEWMDNSMLAILPIPIFAFASPTQEINEIKSDDVLARCGPSDRLANRRVEVDRAWCVPTVLTRIVSLGIWHWCPANVSWDADVVEPAPPTTALVPPPARDLSSRRMDGAEY